MPKSVPSDDQRVVGDAAVRDRVAGARLLGEVGRRLELVDRLEPDLAHHRHQQQVALELDAAVLDGLGGEQPGRHRALAVAHAVADEHVALAPAGVEDRDRRRAASSTTRPCGWWCP